MTLEFERLTADLEQMALTTARRYELRQERLAEALAALETYRTNWTAVSNALTLARKRGDDKLYRSARPFDENEPLDTAVDAPAPPAQATIIATDGSQIMPDRHAAYLYYLINVGGIVYHHGENRPPETFTVPQLVYPPDDNDLDTFNISSGAVSIERDVKEIETLAQQTFHHRHDSDLTLAVLDQRLLYWPIGSEGVAENAAVTEWGNHMTGIRQTGALLCGYIDRPGSIGVTTLLKSVTAVADPKFNWRLLGTQKATQGLTDRDLFGALLAPGQRSKVFVYVSPPNNTFAEQDPANEVCFFYVNPASSGQQIARVDIPRWVAEDEAAVTAVHALIIDQCRLLGDYPYVLARADETAVVGRQDASELNFMIDVIMERHGLHAAITAKQGSKDIARGGRTRFK
ncbi:MAG: DNA double-strand break repair nuclease NurA [Chloroflexi bacterium]|nr:DNA double-strand break repair nuclease NurA [Chloroflexota bacterium]MBP7041580.1 DNA double-strand break repair nuclease NurA [Chloroflexota bacterium]